MPTAAKSDWGDYYINTQQHPPSPLLVEALAYVTKREKAIDVGGGALKDTRYLLSQGFETTVIDKSPQLEEMVKGIENNRLHVHVTRFSKYDFPANTFDIASAMYALPFNLPPEFDTVFANIQKSLVTGGIFVGNMFGNRDAWHERPTMTFHSKAQAQALLADMDVILFQEKEFDGSTADKLPKHWHVFNFIARKK
jgi:tellurite methyltransferase